MGNWKMNGRRSMVESLLKAVMADIGDLFGVEVVVCPPYPYL
ncbi:MAG: triose-phosphate isomerase, partial [Acidiferrobacter sp.]